MHLGRFAVLVGFLFVEAATMVLSLDSLGPADSPAPGFAPALPVLEKNVPGGQFAARFEQTEPIITGDTFYYSSLPTTLERTETREFVILFDFDSSRLSAEAGAIIDTVVNIMKRGQQIRIFATGHTDASGPVSYNQTLSRQRIKAVHEAFIERGVAPEQIDEEAFGEKRPRVTTPDGAPAARNRRVEIVVGPAPKI